jgi:hypothetical protein
MLWPSLNFLLFAILHFFIRGHSFFWSSWPYNREWATT